MSSSAPFFSVVIPTYNCADLLRRSLESVRQQTFRDYEIVLVDNHSTDHTPQVVAEFPDLPIRHLLIHNHGVIGTSRNLGIRSSVGDWVAFLDADDLWYPRKLERVKETLEANPQAILVCSDERIVRGGEVIGEVRCGCKNPNVYEHLLVIGNVLSTTSVVASRRVLNEIEGFSSKPEWVTVEDYECWIRLAMKGPCIFIPELLGEYHLYGGNATQKTRRHVDAMVDMVDYHLDHPAGVFPKWKLQRRRGNVRFDAASLLLKDGDNAGAMEYSRKGMRFWPVSVKGWGLLVLSALRRKA